MIVKPTTDFIDQRYASGVSLRLSGSVDHQQLTVAEARPHGGRLIVQFEELNDRSEAERVRDFELVINQQDMIALDEGEFYRFELIGLKVYGISGEFVGEIKDVHPLGDKAVLEIVSEQHGTVDFPADYQLIDSVDRDAGKIIVHLPRGWEKLARSKKRK